MVRKEILTLNKWYTQNTDEDQGCFHNSKELNVTLTLGYEPTSPFEIITYEVSVRQLPG